MKSKIFEFLSNAYGELSYGLRMLCGKPSPVKRLVAVLILSAMLGMASIYFIVSSIYSIGRNDARRELLELQHIESLELKRDSVRSIEN